MGNEIGKEENETAKEFCETAKEFDGSKIRFFAS